MFFSYEVSPFWRFAPQLNVIEATLLILEIEPQGVSDEIENRTERPQGYEAVKASLLAALRAKELEGHMAWYKNEWFCPDAMQSYEYEDATVCDPHKTFVSVEDLKRWLASKGHTEGYFFAEQADDAPYLNPEHERYSPKLAAAVHAWLEYDPERRKGATPKQSMITWLRLNAPRFGLTSEDGLPSDNQIGELARIANWATKGGAPKALPDSPDQTIGVEPTKPKAIDFSKDFDDEIPF